MERKVEIEKATGKVTAMSGSMSNGYEGYDHTLVECLPSPLGAASGQGETLAARRNWFGSTPIRGFLDLWYQGCAISRMKQKKSNPNMYVDLHSMLAGLHQATRFV